MSRCCCAFYLLLSFEVPVLASVHSQPPYVKFDWKDAKQKQRAVLNMLQLIAFVVILWFYRHNT